MQVIPDWLEKALSHPIMDIPTAGKAVGNLSRNGSYVAASRGFIPTISVGNRSRVPTAWVRRQLHSTSRLPRSALPPRRRAKAA